MNKKLLISIGIVAVVISGGFYFFNDYLRPPYGAIDSQLEAAKDKIEYSALTDRETCIKWSKTGSSTCEQYDKVVVYRYLSDEIVENEIYGVFEENVSKRTEYSRAWDRNGTTTTKTFSKKQHIKGVNEWKKIKQEESTETQFLAQTVSWYQKLLIKVALADTSSIFAGAGDGYVEYNKNPGDSWDTTHDATTGTTAYPTLTTDASIISGTEDNINTRLGIMRGYAPFPTGATIGAAEVVSSSSAHFFVSYDGLLESDHALIESDQPDETTLTTADYNNCGATDNPTEISGRVTSLQGSYNSYLITDNTVVKVNGEASTCGGNTGWTCVCLRDEYDMDDTGPPGDGNDTNQFIHASEFTGTNRDPYILVDHAVASVAVDDAGKQHTTFYGRR